MEGGHARRERSPRQPVVPSAKSIACAFFVALGLWWVLAALNDLLRDLHLAGSIAAVGASDVLRPTVFPRRAAELLRVWEDWDASATVTGQALRSDRVILVWLVVDVAFAIVVGWLVWALARQRRWRGRATGDTPRALTMRTLLEASMRLAVLYVVFDVLENLTLGAAAMIEHWVHGWLNLAYVADVLKLLTLVAAVSPVAISLLGLDRDRALARNGATVAAWRGYGQTLLDLRGQTLAVGFICFGLLFLPGSVRPQLHDVVRGWRQQPGELAVAVVTLLALAALVWWTGKRALCRVATRGDVTSEPLEEPDEVPWWQRRVTLVGGALLACLALAVLLRALFGQGLSMILIASALALWLASALLNHLREVTVTRRQYEVRPGVVRVLAFLPVYSLAVVWMRAELGRALVEPWGYRIVVAIMLVAVLVATWILVMRPAALVQTLDGDHGRQGMRMAVTRLRRREVFAPLVASVIAMGVLVWADSDFGVSSAIGSVGLLGIAAVAVLGFTCALTTLYFGPPRGPLAFVNLKRFPVLTALLLIAVAMSALVTSPGFHMARIDGPDQRPADIRPPERLDAALEQWRATQATGSDLDWQPLVVFASSGGGGRAAYWTLLALDCLFTADRSVVATGPACAAATEGAPRPDYGDVFAASGISGGSVGLAMFTAAGGALDPDAAFEEGFLDPVVANLLTRDLPNAWLHAPGWRDRAARLEQAWEHEIDAMRRPFLAAPPRLQAGGSWEPLLVLNSAAVEDGCRVVVSNVSFAARTYTDPPTPSTLSGSCRTFVGLRLSPPPATDPQPVGVDDAAQDWASTRDLTQIVCAEQNLRMSTAALLSARFPYISPSGAVQFCGEDDRFTYLVDGGTVDSSAAGPAAFMIEQIVRQVREWNASRGDQPCIQPIVVQLDNGYEDVVASGGAGRPSELIAPIQGGVSALRNNADIARQQLAVVGSQLRGRSGCDAVPDLPTYLQIFPQSHPGTEAPTGWSLSQDSRTDMKDQMASDANQCSLLALRYWLTGTTGSGVCITGSVAATEDGEAVSGRDVCLSGPLYGGVPGQLTTNAYGVFVDVRDDGPLTENPRPVLGDDACGSLSEGSDREEYGVDDRLILGLRLRSDVPTPVVTAGWNWLPLTLAGVAGIVALYWVANPRGQAVKRRRDEQRGER